MPDSPGAPPARVGAAAVSPATAKAAPEVERKPDPPEAAFFPAPSIPAPSSQDYDDEEQTRVADLGALVGAFNRAVNASAAHAVSDPLNMAGDDWFVGINGVPVGPIHLGELRSKAATGAINRESLVWRDGFEEWRPLKSFPELAAVIEESLSASVVPPGTESRAGGLVLDPLSDPFAARPAPSQPGLGVGPAGDALVRDDISVEGFAPSRRTSRAAWLAVVAALFFGLTVGFVIFSQKPQEVVRYVPVPAKGQASAAPKVSELERATVAEEVAVQGVRPGTKTAGAKPQNAGAKPEEEKSTLSGLRGLGAGIQGGPNSPNSNGSPSGTRSQLEASQVQQVVARYQPSVKRSCWQPALDTRGKDAPSAARVEVSIRVAPNGSVQKVSTSGDPKGYRGLANCIAGRVRGWQFPASGAGAPVNIPFLFVAQ